MTIMFLLRWAKKRGPLPPETAPTTRIKDNPSETKKSSGLSPFITDPGSDCAEGGQEAASR